MARQQREASTYSSHRRIRRVLESLLGASIIYTAMAACSGSAMQNSGSGGGHAQGGAGQGGSAHGGGAMAGPGGSDGSGIFDALMDPVSDAMADTNSGTRLKAEYVESLDGARQYLLITEAPPPYMNPPVTQNVWFDSMRNEECVFRLAADGKLRCLPGVSNSYGIPPTDAYAIRWVDPQCTGQAYVFLQAPPVNCQDYDPPDYGLYGIDPATQCSNGHQYNPQRVFKVGALAAMPGTATYYQTGNPPVCSSTGGTSNGTVAYLATEIDPTKFAEVNSTPKHDP